MSQHNLQPAKMPEKLFKERSSLSYENLSGKFDRHVPDFKRQYCSIYLIRLKQMENILRDGIKQKWKDEYPTVKLHKLSAVDYPKCAVIGTLFKDQKLKPSILKQLAEGNQLVPQPIRTHFTDSSDKLYIEDELQRYELVGSIQGDCLVTGLSVALLGTDDGKGKFTVESYIFADYRPQPERPLPSDDVYVVFFSGLDLCHSEKIAPNLQLLTSFLCGFMGDLGDIAASKICRVILAGNSIQAIAEEEKQTMSILSKNPDNLEAIKAVQIFDKFLMQLAKVVDVDIMPGENDPSNNILPQKPMHFCMFPESIAYKSANHVSNPYYCSVGGTKILGHSGQAVKDILRYSEIQDPLDALENCLKWSHLVPTAPDTLGCYPYYDSDPFIIEECPHVLFAGNQEEFATRKAHGPNGQEVTLISIPEFSNTFEICILNIKTLVCNTVCFKV